MAGVKSSFVTGARAKIKIGGRIVAFASDLFYEIRVETLPIRAMGKYELYANEPVEYLVNGGFTIIRYTSEDAKGLLKDHNKNGNGPASVILENNGTLGAGAASAPGSHLNPAQILGSPTFDIEIIQKHPGKARPTQQVQIPGTTGAANQITAVSSNEIPNDIPVFLIKDCRITGRSANLNKKTLLMERFTFAALVAGDVDPAVITKGSPTLVEKDGQYTASFETEYIPGGAAFGNSKVGEDGK